MSLYRTTLTLRSASGTPWRADTLFGHLCWSLVYREGEDFLNELLLAEYRRGAPPILLSDGFPSGYLPRPLAPCFPAALETASKQERIARQREGKRAGESRWLSIQEFNAACAGLLAALPAAQPQEEERATAKNLIDRRTNTAGGPAGELFDFIEYRCPAVDLYWRIAEGYLDLVRDFLDDLKNSGYGKRRSVGYGQIQSISALEPANFPDVPDANGFVTLSHFVPAAADPSDGYWTTVVKYGKLGEMGALGPQPFKRPLVQLTGGSCFYHAPVRPWYGRLIEGISDADPRVVQYAYALPVPMRLPSREAGLQ